MPIDPIPINEPLTSDNPNSYMNGYWYRWLSKLVGLSANSATILGSTVSLTNQHASIGLTGIPLPTLANGLYRVTYYARLTTNDGVSSSLAVTIGYTDKAVTCTIAPRVTLTADAVTAGLTDSVMVRIDQSSQLSYKTTYASNTPNKAIYDLVIIVEQIP